MTTVTTPSKIAGLEVAVEGDETDDRVRVLFHWPSTDETPWTVRRLEGVPRSLAETLVGLLAAPGHEDPAGIEATGPGRWLWPDGGSYANFADDAGDDYGFRFIDPDGSEQGPLSSRFIRQLADELDQEHRDPLDPRRPNGAILLRRIADDYDRLISGAEPDDPTERLFAAGFYGVEVGSTDEHATTTRFTATCRDASGVAVHQAEGDTPRLALEALDRVATAHRPTPDADGA